MLTTTRPPLAAAARAERLLWMSPAIFERADYHFYAALALIALCEAASDAESAQYREGLAVHHRQLQAWAEHCPENFAKPRRSGRRGDRPDRGARARR